MLGHGDTADSWHLPMCSCTPASRGAPGWAACWPLRPCSPALRWKSTITCPAWYLLQFNIVEF